jgi:hypothetical protein
MTFLVDGTLGGTFPSWTTATRPASPAVGQMGYNTTTGLFDQYTAGGWVGGLTNASQSVQKSALPAGTVLQVLTDIQQGEQSTTSSSFTNTVLSVSITPTSSTSKIFLLYTGSAGNDGTQESFLTFAKNGTNLLGSGGAMRIWFAGSSSYHFGGFSMSYLDSPATTSATTYSVQFRTNSGVVYISGANATDSLTVWEIAA